MSYNTAPELMSYDTAPELIKYLRKLGPFNVYIIHPFAQFKKHFNSCNVGYKAVVFVVLIKRTNTLAYITEKSIMPR
jgi:hypothetical protein